MREWITVINDDGTQPLVIANKLPFNPLKESKERFEEMRKHCDGSVQFSHTLEEQIGGQLKAGFILTDIYEDRDREGQGLIREYAPQYISTRSVKLG